MTLPSFTKKYCEQNENAYYLKENYHADGSVNPDCHFLEGKRCGVYLARPTQCKTWPFWPDNMKARTWNKEVKTFCPGIEKGPVISKEAIDKILNEERDAECELFE